MIKKNLLTILSAICFHLNTSSQTLLAYYPLTVDTKDSSGHNNSIKLNATTFSNGGVLFNGSIIPTSYGQTNNIFGLTTNSFSVSVDFMLAGINGPGRRPVFVLGSSGRWASLSINTTGTNMYAELYANNGTSTSISPTQILPNTWYNGKINYDGSTMSLFINNNFACSMPISSFQAYGSYDVLSVNYSNGSIYHGWWKNLKVYNGPVTNTVYANNATLQLITTPINNLAGNNNITGSIQNNGTSNITSMDLTYSIDGGPASPVCSLTGINIPAGAYYNFIHNVPANLSYGLHSIKVSIGNVNGVVDDNPADNSFSSNVKTAYAIDASAMSVNNYKYVPNGNNTISGTIKNKGFNPINSYEVTYTIDGGPSSPVYLVSGQNIATDSSVSFSHNVPANLPFGQHSISYTISNINGASDGYLPDNTITKVVYALSFIPVKRVLIEECTGTWCGFCVRGIVYMDSLKQKYPNHYIGVSIHNDGGLPVEVMQVPEYANGVDAAGYSGFPGCVVDRQPNVVDPLQMEKYYLLRAKELSPVEVSITNVSYNSISRMVNFDVNAAPAMNATISWKFNAIVSEDDVTYCHTYDSALYRQVNYYANGVYGNMGGFEKRPYIIPAKDMHFDDVARAILDGYSGINGTIPSAITSGNTYSKSYSYVLGDTLDPDQINLIGLVMENSTGEVLNSVKFKLSSIISINELSNKKGNSIFPNPTSGILYLGNTSIDRAEVYDIYGQLIMSENNLTILDLSNYGKGVYFIKIQSNEGTYTQKIILKKE